MSQPRGTMHVTTAMALDYLDGALEAADRARVEDHLGRPCAECHERMRELGALVERMRLDRVPEVPAELRARAIEAFQAGPRTSGVRGLVEELARLLFDSRLQPLAVTMRRGVGASRRMEFAVRGGSLELELEPEADEFHTLRGRLQLPEAEMHQVEIAVGNERFQTWPGADGGFLVEHVPAGSLQIKLTGPGGRFVVPTLEL